MIICPNCGSATEVRHKKLRFEEDGASVCAIRYYTCGCGNIFRTTQYYYTEEEELVDEYEER